MKRLLFSILAIPIVINALFLASFFASRQFGKQEYDESILFPILAIAVVLYIIQNVKYINTYVVPDRKYLTKYIVYHVIGICFAIFLAIANVMLILMSGLR